VPSPAAAAAAGCRLIAMLVNVQDADLLLRRYLSLFCRCCWSRDRLSTTPARHPLTYCLLLEIPGWPCAGFVPFRREAPLQAWKQAARRDTRKGRIGILPASGLGYALTVAFIRCAAVVAAADLVRG
jgi:hypothetical protein